jgi:hypothetical protein
MNTETNLTIIENMLYTARKEVKDNGAFFLLWGWLVFIASICQSAIYWLGLNHKTFPLTSHISIALDGMAWLILMPLGGILTIIISKKEQKQERVKTWFDDVMKYLWIAFGVMLFIIFFAMGHLGIDLFSIVIGLYGLGIFITGGILKFKPLLIGGIINWVLAITSLFLTPEYVNLCLAASVLIGFIIPGYLLKKQWDTNNHVQAA